LIGALRKAVRTLTSPLERRAARAYRAGPRLADALGACRHFAALGIAAILGYQNETTESSRVIADAYLESIGALAGAGFDCYLSVKGPPLRFSQELFGEILTRAREAGVRLHLDSLGVEAVDPTFALLDGAGSLPRRDIGITLPGRWKRSLSDADWAVERGVAVRVVKGQWEDPEDPGRDADLGFLQVVERLAGRATHVAIASHNAPLVREAAQRLRDRGTGCELELLYGFPMRGALSIARELSIHARMYVSYGYPWLPYSAGEIGKNPICAWWLVRDVLRPHSEIR